MADIKINTPGITFLHALTVLFVGLKLTGHIDWSWWLVLAPLAVPWAAALLLAFAALTTAILELLVDVTRRWFGRSE